MMVTRMDITAAASQDRSKALTDLESLYRRALGYGSEEGDRTALAVKKEIHKILGVYQLPDADTDDGVEPPELAAIREHLEPLGLAASGTPVVELARLAAIRLMES